MKYSARTDNTPNPWYSEEDVKKYTEIMTDNIKTNTDFVTSV